MRTFKTYSDDYGANEVHGMEEAQEFFMNHLENVEDLLLGASELTEPEEWKELGKRLQGLRFMADDIFCEVNEENSNKEG